MHAILIAIAIALCVSGPVEAKSKHGRRPPGNVAGKFDYYVLALSWSPTFCESHPDNSQCEKHPGFVLHGLWPQYQSGGYPQNCRTKTQITPEARAIGVTVFPTEELMEHEWQKHGTCDGRPALDYFKAAAQAQGSVNIPAALGPGNHKVEMTAQQIFEQLGQANQAIPPQGMAIACGSKELTEIHICLSKDLSPRACGKKVNSSCGTGPITIPGAQ
jgi:ribonuclease T2